MGREIEDASAAITVQEERYSAASQKWIDG
jgi:hypothetical protein